MSIAGYIYMCVFLSLFICVVFTPTCLEDLSRRVFSCSRDKSHLREHTAQRVVYTFVYPRC